MGLLQSSLTLRIDGVDHDVEAAPGSWILTRADGVQFTVGPYSCSCGSEHTCPHLWGFWLWAGVPGRSTHLERLPRPLAARLRSPL